MVHSASTIKRSPVPRRRFGRRILPDSRDFQLAPGPKTSGRKMWRGDRWTGDQGSLPACVGYAWAGWLANYPKVQFLDPVGLYELAQLCDEWEGEDYEGSSVRGGAKVLHHLKYIREYQFARTLDEVVNALLNFGPVVCGTDWYGGMSRPRVDDAFGGSPHFVLRPTGRLDGGHAYLLTGVDTHRGEFRVKNSWGSNWADNGVAYLRFSDAAKLLKADGEACLPIEQDPKDLMV